MLPSISGSAAWTRLVSCAVCRGSAWPKENDDYIWLRAAICSRRWPLVCERWKKPTGLETPAGGGDDTDGWGLW